MTGSKVLLIDDSNDALLTLRKLLSLAGHEVHVACDGATGLATARQSPPDIVLCDIDLPGELSGYDVAGAMRGDPRLRTCYLVAVTGYGEEEDRRNALRAGFDRHLTKPISCQQLDTLFLEFSQKPAIPRPEAN